MKLKTTCLKQIRLSYWKHLWRMKSWLGREFLLLVCNTLCLTRMQTVHCTCNVYTGVHAYLCNNNNCSVWAHRRRRKEPPDRLQVTFSTWFPTFGKYSFGHVQTMFIHPNNLSLHLFSPDLVISAPLLISLTDLIKDWFCSQRNESAPGNLFCKGETNKKEATWQTENKTEHSLSIPTRQNILCLYHLLL